MTGTTVSTPGSASASPAPARRRRNAVVRAVAAHWLPLVIAAAAAVFIAQNRNQVSVDLLWAHLKSPLWLVLVATTAAGLVIGVTAARRRARQAGQHGPSGAPTPRRMSGNLRRRKARP